MAIKRITIIFLVIFLAVSALVTVTFAASGSRNMRMLVQAVPAWQQVNSNGFGDPAAVEVSAVEPFTGYLYAGTYNLIDLAPSLPDGTQIFRSANGETWTPVTDPGFGNNHDTAPPAILDMAVFNGYLYAGTGGRNAAQIWRTQDGLNWSRVVNAGFGNPDIVDFSVLAVYDQALYVGATEQDSGVQIWRTLVGNGNLNNWVKQATPAMPVSATAKVSGMAVFNDGPNSSGLYAAVSYGADTPALVWRSYGGAWESVVNNGFGDSNTVATGGMAVFAGNLYVGAGNSGSGAQLWRSSDGDNWSLVTPPFADANNEKVEQVFVFRNELYVGATNPTDGVEIWRTADGSTWEQVNLDGFGDQLNTTTNGSNATADFLDQLYVGTENNTDGGELWRMQRAYEVNLSPDEGQSGLAGDNVIYTLTITNTGYLTDSYDLAASGQTWTTNLSTALVSQLAPSVSTTFSATVTIPPGAVFHDTDMVTITATSQGDSSKSDSAVLTTNTAVMVCGVTTDTPYSLGDIEVTVTALGSDLDCVRVSKVSNSHPYATTSLQTGQYWTIGGLQSDQSSPATVDYEFNLTLPHNVDPFQEAYVCKYVGGTGGTAWDCGQTGSDVSTVWRDGIAIGFSDWAVSIGIPTVITLNSFKASSPTGQTAPVVVLVILLAAGTLAWRFWPSRRNE